MTNKKASMRRESPFLTKLAGLNAVIRRLHWVSLLFGCFLVAPSWWILERTLTRQGLNGVQLASGVVLGALAGWVVPEFVGYVRNVAQKTKPLHQVVGPFASNAHHTTIIIAAHGPGSLIHPGTGGRGELNKPAQSHRFHWVYADNDARAAAFVMATLAAAGKHDVSIEPDDTGLYPHGVHIYIGSPKSNKKSEALFNSDYLGLPVSFKSNDGNANGTQVLKDNLTGHIWQRSENCDIGLILKVRNGSDPMDCTMVVAGVSHMGTVAAGYYLWRNWHSIAADFSDAPFAIVLQTGEYYQSSKAIWKAGWSEEHGWQKTFGISDQNDGSCS